MRSRTPEQARAIVAKHYAESKAEGRCPSCGKKHKPGYPFVRCAECRRFVNLKRCSGAQKATDERLSKSLEYIVKTSETHTASQQAKDLGAKLNYVYWLRYAARKRGYAVKKDYGGRLRFSESARWLALEDAMATPCARCGLRGEHECIPLHADAFLRSTQHRTYPEPGGCGLTTAEKRKMRTPPKNYVYGRGAGKPTPPVVP